MISLDGACYHKKDIDVLQDFIDINSSLSGKEPHQIGYQEWTSNRLSYLYLGHKNISVIPDSIGLLKNLIELNLEHNDLVTIPEHICNIVPFYSELNLKNNKICPPYPYCIDYLSNQNIANCTDYICPKNYTNINGDCFLTEHLQVLQSIIDINPSLNGLSPLDLGSDIGYVGWENGQLKTINLIHHKLTELPASLCSIQNQLNYFDISYNNICPPYPKCFEFIGSQNQDSCKTNLYENLNNTIIVDNRTIIPPGRAEMDMTSFQNDVSVLQAIIDDNPNLKNKIPLEIGSQKWSNMRLTHLDLSNLNITSIPYKICNLYNNLESFKADNNSICPPLPECIEYLSSQNKNNCGDYMCPDTYLEIDGECYKQNHVDFLQQLIDGNSSLDTLSSFFANNNNFVQWVNGKIDQIILTGQNLYYIPPSICDIHRDISLIELSNNSICPPHPECIINIGYQNYTECTVLENVELSCPEGFIGFDNRCYFYKNIKVLLDIIDINSHLTEYHPLLLGYQLWEDGYLVELNLDNFGIVELPTSINQINKIRHLNLDNNKLNDLPETLCDLNSSLQNFQIENNFLCPPYLQCFDYIGLQNTEQCEKSTCPYGFTDINDECYSTIDLNVLNDIISQNESLKNRTALDIGLQKWKNMRLKYLYLGVSELNSMPESICTVINNLQTINISKNNLCPPYPECLIDIVGEQNTSNCP